MIKNKSFLLVLTISVLLLACEKTSELLDENIQYEFADTINNAQVKFVHTYSSLTPALTAGAGPVLQIFMDGKKLTAATSTLNAFAFAISGSATSNVFPISTQYSLLPAGNHTFHFVMNRFSAGNLAPIAGDTVFKTTTTIDAGKKYSFFLVDTLQTPNVLIKEDTWTVPAPGSYQVRFTNLVANPTQRVDVYSIRQNANLFTNVGYKEVTNYVELPVPTISDSLIVRLAGTMTVRDTLKAFLPVSQRVYTWMSRGKTGVTGRPPTTSFYTNR